MTAHAPTTPMPAPTTNRAALATLWGGLAMTILVTVAAFVDDATTRMLAGHIQASYPSYGTDEIGTATSIYLVVLAVVGGLGVLTWIATIWATARGTRWAPWLATVVFLTAVCIALAGLTVRDTSGDVGLVPVLAWLQVIPCVVGLVAVAHLWRQRR
ncbi:hypothetical protein [Agromyces sp. NPDC049794]|uniref:hypothetical protein n=1 Tax=unclassified Agromyces TaxID=2639701 RepID=UPI0033F2007C